MNPGITEFGALHTAISLVAVSAGIVALIKDRMISLRSPVGRIYVIATVLTCATGFFIFHHGGFGKPRVLGIVTLTVLALSAAAGGQNLFGRASRYVEALGYTLTLFFHMIPAFTETGTRLPSGAPLFGSPDDPTLQKVIAVVFIVFAIGMVVQARGVRGASARARVQARFPSR